MKAEEGEGDRNRRGAAGVGPATTSGCQEWASSRLGTDSPASHPQHQPHEAHGLIATLPQRKRGRGRDLPTATQLVCGSFASKVPTLAFFSATRPVSPHSLALRVVRLSV